MPLLAYGIATRQLHSREATHTERKKETQLLLLILPSNAANSSIGVGDLYIFAYTHTHTPPQNNNNNKAPYFCCVLVVIVTALPPPTACKCCPHSTSRSNGGVERWWSVRWPTAGTIPLFVLHQTTNQHALLFQVQQCQECWTRSAASLLSSIIIGMYQCHSSFR